jgi:hypothetical protein
MRDRYKRLRLAQYLTLATLAALLALAAIGPNRCASPTAAGAAACESAVAQSQSTTEIALARPAMPAASVQR